jgi:hypothetical protein
MKLTQDNINTALSLLATFVSLSAAALGYWQFRESERSSAIAIEALAEAKRANDISLGNANPQVCIYLREAKAVLDPSSKKPILLSATNCGTVQIIGVSIKIIPMTGLVYKMDAPLDSPYPLDHYFSYRLDFPEALSKTGAAVIDISPLLSAAILQNLNDFKHQTARYRGVFNIVLSPVGLRDTLPVSGGGGEYHDRDLVTVDFVPAQFQGLSIEELKRQVTTPNIIQ